MLAKRATNRIWGGISIVIPTFNGLEHGAEVIKLFNFVWAA